MLELLAVYDGLERALHAAADQHAGLRSGVALVQRQLALFLEREGLQLLPGGEAQLFDPRHQEAVAQVESETLPPRTVATVLRRGFLRRGRLFRPTQVVVVFRPDP